jgi:protein phosphatase
MPHMSDAQRDDLPRNVITRALGMSEGVMVDVASDVASPDDRFVLCSDGLSGMISDEEILAIVLEHDEPGVACEALIALANQHGGEDNITAVVVHVLPDARSVRPPAPVDATVEAPAGRATEL